MNVEKKFNYVYEMVYPNGMKYIGVRSCNCELVEDSYVGSGFYIPEHMKQLGTKTILSLYQTREEAMNEEIRIHAMLDIKNNPEYYNRCNSTSTKFQVTQEAIERGALKRIGRTKESHVYVANQAKAMSKYKGKENRTAAQLKNDNDPIRLKAHSDKLKLLKGNDQTDAQKAGRISMKAKLTGVKNPAKGHPGITSTSFVPWYYIEPNGDRHEMYSISKKDFAKKIGVTYRTFIYRFSAENEHKPMLALNSRNNKLYMWTFGNLAVRPQSIQKTS
jgi:hypothetical protein